MPYIKPDARVKINPYLEPLLEWASENEPTEGELNYIISSLIWTCFEKNVNYKTANALIGVLECAKLELYRTQIAPYEELKAKENGTLEIESTSDRLTRIIEDGVINSLIKERKQGGLLDLPRNSGFKNSKQKRDKAGRFLKSA
jgi:hypothetical protein